MAAARNVSAAASMTVWRVVLKKWASLAVLVVLPVPLTPTMRMALGLARQRIGWPRRARQQRDDGRAGDLGHVLAVTVWVAACLQGFDDFQRQRHAEVRADERFLEFVPNPPGGQ